MTGRGASDGVYGLEPMMRTLVASGGCGVAGGGALAAGLAACAAPAADDPGPGVGRSAATFRSRQTRRSSRAWCRAAPPSTRCCAATAWPTRRRCGVVNAAREVFDPRRLRALQPFSLERTLDGTLRFFQYQIDNDRFLRIAPASAGSRGARRGGRADSQDARARHRGRPHRSPRRRRSSSRWPVRARARSWPWRWPTIFSGEIDFNSDVQPGDAYALAFDKFTREGGAVELRRHHAPPSSSNDGRVLRAIRFTRARAASPAYYDEQGRSLRRFFLRSPLKFEPRITSRFSSSRLPSGAAHGARASRRRLRRAARAPPVIAAAVGRGRRRHLRRHQRPHGARAPRVGLRVVSTCTCRRSAAASARACAWSRARPSASWAPPVSRPVRICTTACTRNGVFVNPLREHRNHAARRAGAGGRAWRRSRVERDRALGRLARSPAVAVESAARVDGRVAPLVALARPT